MGAGVALVLLLFGAPAVDEPVASAKQPLRWRLPSMAPVASHSLAAHRRCARARIYLVDLAGSERAGLYAMDPEQLKEGEAINLSLSALGRVVGALATGKCKHVPYRDSALTWLLKDAVTGTSARVCMVAAVHPNHAQESASTLRYAHQYSALQTSSGSRVSDLTSEVRQQQRRVDGLKRAFESACAGTEHGIAWTPEASSGVWGEFVRRQPMQLVVGRFHCCACSGADCLS